MDIKQSKNIDTKKSAIIQTIAKNLKEIRLQKDISQEYLAELANLHRNQIGLIERCETNVTIISLDQIANALQVHITELLK